MGALLGIVASFAWELISYNDFQFPRAVIDFGSSVIH
jgi:hypothetical protein